MLPEVMLVTALFTTRGLNIIVGVSPSGKASAFGADIRWFESSHPSHRLQRTIFCPFFFCFQDVQQVRMFDVKYAIHQTIFELFAMNFLKKSNT